VCQARAILTGGMCHCRARLFAVGGMDAHGEALVERFLLNRTLGGAWDALALVSPAWRMLAAIDVSSSVGLRVVFPNRFGSRLSHSVQCRGLQSYHKELDAKHADAARPLHGGCLADFKLTNQLPVRSRRRHYNRFCRQSPTHYCLGGMCVNKSAGANHMSGHSRKLPAPHACSMLLRPSSAVLTALVH
jgi:hypothetical protein